MSNFEYNETRLTFGGFYESIHSDIIDNKIEYFNSPTDPISIYGKTKEFLEINNVLRLHKASLEYTKMHLAKTFTTGHSYAMITVNGQK